MPEGVGYGPQFTASTGLTLNYVGNHVYAYSGVVTANGSDTTALEFTTANEIIVGSCYPTVNGDELGANFLSFQVKFNGNIIITYKERRDLGQMIEIPFSLIIPPFTHVEVIFPNNAQAADLTAVLTGRIYGKVD